MKATRSEASLQRASKLTRDSIKKPLINQFFVSYQYGPDTYLLQLRDTNFPARLREYIKVAKGRSPSFNYSLTDSNYDLSVNLVTKLILR